MDVLPIFPTTIVTGTLAYLSRRSVHLLMSRYYRILSLLPTLWPQPLAAIQQFTVSWWFHNHLQSWCHRLHWHRQPYRLGQLQCFSDRSKTLLRPTPPLRSLLSWIRRLTLALCLPCGHVRLTAASLRWSLPSLMVTDPDQGSLQNQAPVPQVSFGSSSRWGRAHRPS